jgi:hypothetical protein
LREYLRQEISHSKIVIDNEDRAANPILTHAHPHFAAAVFNSLSAEYHTDELA